MKKLLLSSLILGTMFLPLPSFSKSQVKGSSSSPPSSIQNDVNALALYPVAIRQSIQIALQYPDVLSQIATIQAKSSSAFKALIASYPKNTQQQIWQLIQYPTLLDEMVGGERDAYKTYPKEIQPIASNLVNKNFDLLTKISKIDDQPQKDFENLIQSLASGPRTAFQKLVQHPEILNILIQNLGLNQGTGNIDLNEVRGKAQELASKLTQASAIPTDQLKASAGDDPTALAKLQKASDSLEKGVDYEQDVNPHPKAATVNVGFSPYPFYNGFTGMFYYPLWYGYPLGF